MKNMRALVAGNVKFMAQRKVNNAASEGEIYIYDVIGKDWFGGIGAQDVVQALKDMGKVKTLNVYINSPGGDVFEGVAIYNAIKRHCDNINVFVDGLAASAASFIAMVGSNITMGFNSMLMIHNPWGVAIGEAADMRKTADMLDKVRDTIVETYVKRTGIDVNECKKMMDEETWLTAAEAKEKKFCDEVTEEDEEAEDAECECTCKECKNGKCADCSCKGCDSCDSGACECEDEGETENRKRQHHTHNLQQTAHPLLNKFKNTPQELRALSASPKARLADMSMYVSKLKQQTPKSPGQPGGAKASRSAKK